MKQQSNSPAFFEKVGGFFKKLWGQIKTGAAKAWGAVKGVFRKKDAAPAAGATMRMNTERTRGEQDLPGVPERFEHLFEPKRREPNFALGTILTIAKMLGICLVLVIIAGVGAVFGVAKAYLGTTPELDLVEINSNDLTSYIYDGNGGLITTYAGVENRDYATLDEIPLYLQQAVVAIEDTRFYSHQGVDFKGLLGALLGNLTSDSVAGGSTITQQLIKNKLLTTEKSYKRKIQEISLAMQLEQVYTKDQILEAYLNSMPLGGTNYGVKAAALDYFGKELNELTLRECACLAGVTQYPWLYSPRRAMYVTNRMDDLNKRIDTVLQRMYQSGYITLQQRDEAMAEELVVLEKSIVTDLYDYPHFVEYAIYDVVTHLLRERELEDTTANRNAISNELRTGGYHIYTTIDPDIQNAVQTTLSEAKYPNMGKNDSVIIQADGTEVKQPQAAAVVLEQQTGELKAIVGSRDIPTTQKSLNRAYQARMPVGSSIKPIAVYGPAFDAGAGLGTIIANVRAPIDGWKTSAGHPTTSIGTEGPTSIRKGITSSLNIVAARTLVYHAGVENSYNYLLNMGISPVALNADGVGLALGTSGITVIEMAGAYGTVANGGEYREPLSFRQIKDSEGNIILDAEQTRVVKQVYKPSSAYMLVDALIDAVDHGTGWRAKISGITTAGKTGTNHGNRGVFFAGMTGYYVSTIWLGHDNYKALPGAYGGDTAAPIWKKYMELIHEGLENKKILEGSASSYGVTTKTVCAVSGMIPTAACAKTASDYFGKDSAAATEPCNMCSTGMVCSVSGETMGMYCPASVATPGAGIVIPEDSPYAALEQDELLAIFPNLIIGATVGGDTNADGTPVITHICSYHTYEWAVKQEQIAAAKTSAQPILDNARTFRQNNQAKLTQAQLDEFNAAISKLEKLMAMAEPEPADITNAANALSSTLKKMQDIVAALPPPAPPTPPAPPATETPESSVVTP